MSSADRVPGAPGEVGPGGASRALLKRLAGGAAIGAAVKFGGVGLAFLMLLVLARRMDADAYGVFAAAFSLATIAGFVATLGQHVAILRFWPALDEAHGRAAAGAALRFTTTLALAGVSAVATGFGLIAIIDNHLSLSGIELNTVLLTGLMTIAFGLSNYSLFAVRAAGYVVFSLCPREIAWRLAVVLAIWVIPGTVTANIALLLVSGTLFMTTLPQIGWIGKEIFDHLSAKLPEGDRHDIRRSIVGFWGGGVLPTFSDHLGTIVVATVLGPVAAGAYFAAERIAKLLSIALIGVNQIVGPMIARSWRAERLDEVRLLVLGGSAMAFFVASIGFFAYLLVGRFALRLFDPAYSDAYGVLLILAAGQLVNAICGPNNYLLNMVGLERTYMWIMLGWGGAAVVLISLSALLFGITGAAVGAAVTMIGWNLTILYVAESHLNIGLISFFKNLKKEHAR